MMYWNRVLLAATLSTILDVKSEQLFGDNRQDSIECLEKYKYKLSWKSKASVLDMGSGDGWLTANVLKKHIPKDFKELIGIDISEEMVDFANKKYKDERISFQKMDIAGKVPKELKGRFDHVFSSSAFQFVSDHETAFENVREVLIDGGNCLLNFSGYNPLYTMYIIMSQREKWRPWSEEIMKTIVTRYHYLEKAEAVAEAKRLMQEAGFKDIHVECNDTTFIYMHTDDLLNMVTAANLWHLPTELLEDHWNDMKEVIFENNLVARVDEGSDTISLKYQRMEIFGRK